MIRGPKKTVSVTLPLDRYEQLKELADQTGYTLPGYIRRILHVHLQYVEELPDLGKDLPPIL